MREFILRHKTDIILWGSLFLGFFFTRLFHLDLIPIFTDEAIYLRWSQIMAHDASLRYLPLVDGKPPLFMWLTAVVMRVLPNLDPLLSGRLVSVGSGLFSLGGVIFTSHILFADKKVTFLAALLYVFIPFTFFYDRFGLADSLLAGFGIWCLGLGALLVRTLRLDVALILGNFIGLGLLTKTPALFFLVSLPLQLLLFDWHSNNRKVNLVKLAGLILLVLAISQAIFSVLRLFPLFHMINQKNMEFIVTPAEFLRHPFEYFLGNLRTLLVWEVGYLTAPVTILIALAALGGKVKQKLILLVIFSVHLLYMSFFNKSIFPRFLLTFTPGLLILAAVGFVHATRNLKFALSSLILLIILAQSLFIDFKLLTDPPNAPIPDGDSNQYINAWPAGYGVNKIRSFLAAESRKYPRLTIGTEGTFGLMPYALQIYQQEYPNVEIKDYWPLPEKVPQALVEAASDHPTYFIIYQRQVDPSGWKVREVASFQQGRGTDRLRLYQILLEGS